MTRFPTAAHLASYLDWPVMWTGQVELRMGADLVVGLST